LDFRLSQIVFGVPENATPGNFCILHSYKLLLVHSEILLSTPLLKIYRGARIFEGGQMPLPLNETLQRAMILSLISKP